MTLTRTRAAWIVGGIAFLALVLRWWGGGASLWGDEISSFQRAQASFSFALTHLASPLSVWLAQLGIALFGEGERAFRLYSLLAGVAAIPLMYRVGAAMSGRPAGVTAALLLALSAYHLHHSQHARYYALLMLAAVLWAYGAQRLLETGKPRWAAVFAASGFLGLLIHEAAVPLYAAIIGGSVLGAMGGWIAKAGPAPSMRGVALLAAAAIIGASGLATLYLVQDRLPVGLLHWEAPAALAPDAANAAEPAAAASTDARPRHQLTLRGYAGFLREYLHFKGPLWPISLYLGVFALAGFAVALKRRPVLAGGIAAGILVTPLPFLFIDAAYPYEARYFSGSVPLLLLLAAAGMTGCVRFLAARVTALGAPRARAALLAVLVGIAVIGQTADLRRYHAWHPEKDWQSLARHMAPLLQPDDHIHYLDPQGIGRWRFRTTLREYYFRRYLAQPEAYLRGIKENHGNPDAAAIRAYLRRHPNDTHWFYAIHGATGPAADFLDEAADFRKDFNGITAWVIGKPTHNLLDIGRATRSDTPWQPAPGEESYSGGTAIKFSSPEPVLSPLGIRISEPADDAVIPLRNAAFHAWHGGAPAGWRPSGQPGRHWKPSDDSHHGARALELQPVEGDAWLEQPLADGRLPGRRVEVAAMMFADAPDAVSFGVRYRRDGAWEERQSAHPGGGEWRTGRLEASIPADAEPDSLRVFVRRTPGVPGAARVDEIAVTLKQAGPSLDPDREYTLSMRLRYDNLRYAEETANIQAGAGMVLLAYHIPGEGDHWVELERFHGTSDWRLARYRIRPGRDVPPGAEWLFVRVQLLGSGTMWVDHLQLEEGPFPTPYTPSRRLPHDERFPD